MHSHILFHLEWHMVVYGGWIIVGGCLIFSPLSWHVMYTIVLFVSCFSIPVIILLISYFVFILFIEVLILFNLVLQLEFLFGFFISPYFLKFLILSSKIMLKFFSFNFIIRSNFMLFYFFLIWLSFFFSFIKAIF
jgi:hypothetical protein